MNLSEKVKDGDIETYLLPLAIIFIFFFSWQVLSEFNMINAALFSSPSEILKVFSGGGLISHNELFSHIISSLFRLFISFTVASALGIAIGIGMGLNRYVYRFFDPIITVLMPIPGIAWAPLFIIWIGLGNPNVLAVGGLVTFFPVVHNTASGVRSIDENLIKVSKMTGTNRLHKIKSVIIPGSLPHIITGLKLGLARCWRTIIAVEMIVATTSGLGYMIIDASDHLQMSIIYAGIIALSMLYFVMEYGFKRIEKNTVERWGMRSDQE